MSASTAVKASISEKATFRYQHICILLLLKIRKKNAFSRVDPPAEAYAAYANFLALPCKTVSKENVEF